MAGLDKTRPYGTITGDDQGRLYEQDGQFFGADGSLWTEPAGSTPAADKPARSAAKRATVKPAEEPTPDQLATQLGLAGGTGDGA